MSRLTSRIVVPKKRFAFEKRLARDWLSWLLECRYDLYMLYVYNGRV